MNVLTDKSKANIQKKQLELRAQLWPELKITDLWLRKGSRGFTTIPRTMPLIMAIMDSLSKNHPVSSAYFDLWCRAYDECFVTLNKSREMAFYSGFSGQRAEQTWETRIKLLVELGFIKVAPGPSGAFSYAVILNPYRVVQKHRKQKSAGFSIEAYNALVSRVMEIGATDLDTDLPSD